MQMISAVIFARDICQRRTIGLILTCFRGGHRFDADYGQRSHGQVAAKY
jgi:hypothetical protein